MDHQIVARIHREVVGGEVVGVTLELVPDMGTVQIAEGDEFVTGHLAIDPWESEQPNG